MKRRKKPTWGFCLYLRKEPNKKYPHLNDVAAYSDHEAREGSQVCKWSYEYHDKLPDRRNKYVAYNCMTHHAVWLEDLKTKESV